MREIEYSSKTLRELEGAVRVAASEIDRMYDRE